jgi:hypothetical protein
MRSGLIFRAVLVLVITAPLVTADDGRMLYSRWTPVAIYADGVSSATLEVWTEGDIDSVSLRSGSVQFGELHDDGLDGDRVAGDDIWTISGITRGTKRDVIPGAGMYGFNVDVTPRNGAMESTGIGGIGLPDRTRQKVKKVAKNVYRGKWGAFLIDKKGEFFDGEIPLCNVRCGKGNEKVFQTFFKYFPDKFDFLVVMPFTPVFRPDEYTENVPYFVPVRNNVRNIGIEVFDDGAEFGSKKKLKGVIYHSFGCGAILDHEIGHAWGIRIGEAQGLKFSGNDCAYHNTYGWHISEYSNQVGQMAAFPQLDLKSNGDGTYKVTQVGDRETDATYAPLTLYLMGMIPPEDVPPVMILRNENYPDYDSIPKSEFDIFTIEEIMAANGGERIPAYPNTQKKFRVGFIFVGDRKFTQAEYDFFSQIPQYFQSKDGGMNYLTPFYHATGRRGSLKCRMSKPLKEYR